MNGKALAKDAFFLPILSASHPNTGVPNIAPMQKVEATNETWSTVSGAPRGELSTFVRIGREGETQPMAQPWLNVRIFAGSKIIWN